MSQKIQFLLAREIVKLVLTRTYVLSFGSKRENQRKLPLFRRSGPTTKGLLAPWNPKEEGRGRAGLKNRQDTFFDAPPTRSRLTAPPKNSPPGRGGACPARDITITQKSRVACRGGIYAARAIARILRYTGQTLRDAFMRLLQTCRKWAFYRNRQIPRRGGVTPPYVTLYKNVSARRTHFFIIYYFLFIISPPPLCKATAPLPKNNAPVRRKPANGGK